jgi:hypothetical protein
VTDCLQPDQFPRSPFGVGQAAALREHGADVVVSDLAELLR